MLTFTNRISALKIALLIPVLTGRIRTSDENANGRWLMMMKDNDKLALKCDVVRNSRRRNRCYRPPFVGEHQHHGPSAQRTHKKNKKPHRDVGFNQSLT